MTDREIIKALECCPNDDCDNCPYGLKRFPVCIPVLVKDAISLITRKQAEIEKIKIKLNSYKEENDCLRGYIGIKTEHQLKGIVAEYKGVVCTAKSEARKEFAERVSGVIDEMSDVMWDENTSKCRVENCRYPSNIPCGNEICLEENKAFWRAKIDNLLKELDGAEG